MELEVQKLQTHFRVLGFIPAALYPYDILRFVIKEKPAHIIWNNIFLFLLRLCSKP